jgi:hypothetical protein
MQHLRKRIHVTPATVIASLALVFAMTGGAYAASKILITSTKQISPKVLKSLQGKAGKAGANGAQGPAGATGAAGPQGPGGAAGAKGETGAAGASGTNGTNGTNGTTGFTETLPSGKTLKGDWSVGQAGPGLELGSVSFGIPLESAPIPIYIKQNGATPAHCTGGVANPGADPGYLCVFAFQEGNITSEPVPGVNSPKVCSNNAELIAGCALAVKAPSADPSGFDVTALAEASGYAFGTWAVTAE